MSVQSFADYSVEVPDLEAIRLRYISLMECVDTAKDVSQCIEVLNDWDRLFRELNEWSTLVQIRFYQNTENSEYKEAQDHLDAIWPKYVDLETQFKNKILSSPLKAELEARQGSQLFKLWELKVSTFDPEILDDLSHESKLTSEYTALIAKAQVDFEGSSLTLPELNAYKEDTDRSKREQACIAGSNWFFAHAATLDHLYDEQVRLRNTMALKMGYSSFVELGYKRMARIDYGPQHVNAFRTEVLREVVPLCEHLAELQASEIGVETLMHWDASVHCLAGNPKPLGDHDWMIERARSMFGEMGHGLDEFFEKMIERGLMDLKSRKGKGGGGFCEYLPVFEFPFIFANFNGTRGDVDVFTHEMGHAFQVWSSGKTGMSELAWPTTEACEIHSMGLEFLTWPWMGLFYGEESAEVLRKIHLTSSLMFLPYGVSVDLFQHRVYENPEASPEERNAIWQEIEKEYLPWYQYGDLRAEKSGRLWQMKQHIYTSPFYYIDYTLALTGALQFWQKSRIDHEDAMTDFAKLCQAGGQLPYSDLLNLAGLQSPFSTGCLKDVITDAKDYLLA